MVYSNDLFFLRLPVIEKSTGLFKTTNEFFLYDAHLNVMHRSKDIDKIVVQALRSQPEFLGQMVQMDFLNGSLMYQPESIPVLKAWINKKGVDHVRAFSEQVLLSPIP